jgi:hypothetical protein
MVEALKARVQELMRERLSGIGFAPSAPPVVSAMLADLREKAVLYVGRDESGASFAKRLVEMAGGRFTHHPAADTDDHAALEASLIATDLVICQSGCVSHNAYWRVQDHCRRTGKQCVLVRQPRPVEFLPRRSAVTRTDRNDGSSDD